MVTSVLSLSAVALYILAAYLLSGRLFSEKAGTENKRTALVVCVAALVLHGAVLYGDLAPENEWHLGFSNALSIVCFSIALVFTALACSRSIDVLGVAIMPAAALSVLVAWLWPAGDQGLVTPSPHLTFHLIVSLIAYAFLGLAVVQAFLLNVQEKRLREHHPGGLIKSLPPIQTMEGLLFIFTGIGFTLLTLTLISGALYTRELFGVALAFNHHTVLSIAAWVIFGVLLIGRFRFGWRGSYAAHWTISGFFVLLLAYFGTKYVTEYLLA